MGPNDRGAGVLLGLACGDALGEPVEGWPADRIAAEHGTLAEFVGGASHRAGSPTTRSRRSGWHGASSCAAGSTPTTRVGASSSGSRRTRSASAGSRGGSCTGSPTARWESASRAVREASPEGRNAGTGSAMRCAPVAVAYADSPDVAAASRASSRLTNADPLCVHGCAVLNRTIAGCPADDPAPLDAALSALPGDAPDELVAALEPVPDGIEPGTLRPTGYVVDTLRTALYHAPTANDAETAIVDAVNAGGDTDTIGVVAGAVAGGRFGARELPDRWLTDLDRAGELRRLGRELAALEP